MRRTGKDTSTDDLATRAGRMCALTIRLGVMSGTVPDVDDAAERIAARLEAGEGVQTVMLFDYDALPGDD